MAIISSSFFIFDVTYAYDDPMVPFSKGRLARMERDSHGVDYRYDRWGRLTQDGQLGYLLDKNSNCVFRRFRPSIPMQGDP